ncbi:MAG: ATP-binding protein [Gammaproteobacteria bacterium]|nr:ATP-binding protein [Gammaproteobacteria bacterium]
MLLSPWIKGRLGRKFLLGNAAGLMLSSVVFLVLFVSMYRGQLEAERGEASAQVNALLQTSLENAMLKRDLEGLHHIVSSLGEQPGIRNVMIVNPADEVRFASSPEMLGRQFDRSRDATCQTCHQAGPGTGITTIFTTNELGHLVLRSVNPVQNREACTGCHGSAQENPINGVLFVDYDAAPIRQHALNTTLALMGAGVCVMLVTLTGGWWFMRRFVLQPVRALHAGSRQISVGALDARVDVPGEDELAELGRCFNGMAASLEQSLKQLREKEAFLQGLVDAVPDGLRVIDRNHRVVLANQAYRRQLGLGSGEGIGECCYTASYARKEPCPATLLTCPLHEIEKTGRPLKTVHSLLRKNRSTMDVEIYAAPMRIARNGHEDRFVVESIRDLESAVQFSHEQKLSELGRLAAGVAHEIHNPLTSIRLFLDSAMGIGGRGVPSAAEVQEYLKLVDEEINRCIEVTARLLKLSIYSGTQAQVVALNSAVQETVSLLSWEATQRGITVEEVLDPTEPRVIAGESDLRMVILNLVQNAFHAMPKGGRLSIRTLRQSGHVRAVIADTGVGIKGEDLPHIFSPFFSRRADGKKGTGLGLSISRTNVERYGGQLTVSSVPGKGSVFTVSFPDPDADAESAA